MELTLSTKIDRDQLDESIKRKWMDEYKKQIPDNDTHIRQIPVEERGSFRNRVYCQWFRLEGHEDISPWWHLVNYKNIIKQIAKFRLGAHNLEINTGRWAKKPRNTRFCKYCMDHEHGSFVEDEVHMCLECNQYDDIRLKFPKLCLPPDGHALTNEEIKLVFNGISELQPQRHPRAFWNELGTFLKMCFERRAEYLESTVQDGAGEQANLTNLEQNLTES